jgi:putative oxidoreductase
METIAHLALAAPFAVSAIEKAMRPAAALAEVTALQREAHLSMPAGLVLPAVVAAQGVGAIMLVIPPLAPLGAALLIAFLAPTTMLVHRFWDCAPELRKAKLDHFLANVAILGGLGLIAARDLL